VTMSIVPYFSLRVFSAYHRPTDIRHMIAARDEDEARRMVNNLMGGIKGFEDQSAWQIAPIATDHVEVEIAELLSGMDRYYLIETLRRAGVISKDLWLDGRYYACISYAEDDGEPVEDAHR